MVGPHLGTHVLTTLHGILGICSSIKEKRIVGQGSITGSIAVHTDEIISPEVVHLGSNHRQGTIITKLVTCPIHPRIGSIGPTAVLENKLSRRGQYTSYLLCLPQVGIALIEATGIGASCLGQHRMRNGGQGSVIGAPPTMTRIEVYSGLNISCSSDRHTQAHCHQQYFFCFHRFFVFSCLLPDRIIFSH